MVVHCYDVNKVSKLRPGYKKDQGVTICATCKLYKYKNLDFKTFGVKTKISHCASWLGCVKHVQNLHYLHDPKDLEENVTNPKAHWDDFEHRKARLRGVETQLQGRSTLDECMGKYEHGSVERKHYVAKLCISAPALDL